MNKPILPGATLGVLGSGQLGRMFALAAREMGYRIHVFSNEGDSPTGQVADREFIGDYTDSKAIAEFSQSVDVVTFEFENVPASATDTAEQFVPVRPAGAVLQTTQNRLREKTTLAKHGLPVTPFAPVRSLEELKDAIEELKTPAVLKTAAWGYDGKGQTVIKNPEDAERGWQELQTDEAILEAFIEFDCEISVVAARTMHDGNEDLRLYGPILNDHENHILDVSSVPAGIPQTTADTALDIARRVMNTLDVIGVLCVEFFKTPGEILMINELAPRPHNSGHLTIEAHATSQFEQQVRAVCGLPLGSNELLRPAAMANLLGDVWANGEPHWDHALCDPNVKLHLYGKQEPRTGRKMGHLTAYGETVEAARASVMNARTALTQPPASR
ncbi:5-(carboxyamino)imidazole ribonucleotide synthase [Thalassoroseus pseudoceratinae]|uniref:5-(carboxyamino)imidazole ribonucleotide synthase n=1 Tax=Thalassoroseus pseudoceratinae TaxID=2713176 RepID=UPI00141E6675|nr:5-(carboxyamino)imidazole ribonucleotide synthase [Thalassoroseus pseudoceratinae]